MSYCGVRMCIHMFYSPYVVRGLSLHTHSHTRACASRERASVGRAFGRLVQAEKCCSDCESQKVACACYSLTSSGRAPGRSRLGRAPAKPRESPGKSPGWLPEGNGRAPEKRLESSGRAPGGPREISGMRPRRDLRDAISEHQSREKKQWLRR